MPMLKAGTVIGAISVTRLVPGPFSEPEVALLQTFADQAVIAIENVRLFNELEARNRDLTGALEQQTATGEILRVISSSPTDVQPVFDSLVASAARLCSANDVLVLVREGEGLRPAAGVGPLWQGLTSDFRVPVARGSIAARSVIDGTTLHVPDLAALPEGDFSVGRDMQRRFGHRTVLAVPLLCDEVALGTIFAFRFEVRPFADQQIALMKTFADQAVIAIENVRLFQELEARNRELTETLEQQTATAEFLRAISSSPTDAQPVFDAIVRSASRLCGGEYAIVTRYDGELLHLAAQHNPRPGTADETARFFPQRPRREASITARALIDAVVVHVSDIESEKLEPSVREAYRRIGGRAVLSVPMIGHERRAIGVVSVSRGTPGAFSPRQVDLLRTFADQAVIAIENVRVFSELQDKNRALTVAHGQVTEALEQQMATAEILKVISSSPTDTQPVFDAIAANAARLCSANDAQVLRVDGDVLRLVAAFGAPSMPSVRRLTRGHLVGRAVIDRKTIHVRDLAQAAGGVPRDDGGPVRRAVGARRTAPAR